MGYFEDVYLNRLNRYGNNYQERVLTQRREVFSRRLLKSVYRIDFLYREKGVEEEPRLISATFERYKQNSDTPRVLRYLFTEYDVIIPNGTVLFLPDPIGIARESENNGEIEISYSEAKYNQSKQCPYINESLIDKANENDIVRPWMVYYLEDSGAKGYNRYVMLKMTHYLEWKDRNKQDQSSYAYLYGQQDNMLKDEIVSRSRMDPIYAENLKTNFFIMPANKNLRKDDYFIIDKEKNNKVLDEFYRVTGYDIQSLDGVEYVTIDPIYEFASDYYETIPVAEIGNTCQHQYDDWGHCIKCGYKKEKEVKDFTPEIDKDSAGFWLMGQIEEEKA